MDRAQRRISFVVATRDSARTIERCIASLLAQGTNHEVIVVDAGSTDETYALVERAGVEIIAGGPGRPAQRNRGSERATGEYVCFIDGDQILDPGAADEIVAAFHAFPSVAALAIPQRSFGSNYLAKGMALAKVLQDTDPAGESAVAFRASVLDHLGGFNDALAPPFDEFEFTDRVRVNGLVVSKIDRVIYRDEGRPSLRTLCRERTRYGAEWRSYTALRPTNRPIVPGTTLSSALRRSDVPRLPAMVMIRLVSAIAVAIGRWLTPRSAVQRVGRPNDPADDLSWVRRHAAAVAYVVPMSTVALATFTWFSPGRIFAGGEHLPMPRGAGIQTATRYWGYEGAGEGGPVAEMPRIFEEIIFAVVRLLGGSPATAQHLLVSIALALAAAGVVFCFRQIMTNNSWLPSVAAILALANPGIVSFLPDPAVPCALAASGFVAGAIIRAGRKPTSFRTFALATLPVAYVALRPSLLGAVGICAVLALGCAAALSGRRGLTRSLRTIAAHLPFLIVANAWWAVPTIVASGSAGSFIGSEAAVPPPSLARVATLTSHWAWDGLSWTVHFRDWPLVAAQWFLPAMALLAPLVAVDRRLRRIAIGSVAVAITAVLGFQSDIASWGGLVLVVCFATNALIALDAMFTHASRWRSSRLAPRLAAAYLALGIGITGFPMFTGAVAPIGSADHPGMRVAIPRSWTSLGKDLDSSPVPGKVLVLPIVSRGATSTWGYAGVVDPVRLVSSRPTILPSEQDRLATFDALIRLVEKRLVAGSDLGLERLIDALGVSHVVVRHDLTRGQRVIDTDAVTSVLDSSGLFRRPTRYGSSATVFTRTNPIAPVRAYPATQSYDARDPREAASAIAELQTDTAGIGVSGTPPSWNSTSGRSSASVLIRRTQPHGYKVHIEVQDDRDVVVALADAAHRGWDLTGAPAGTDVTPVTVDGYRQGWWIRAPAAFDAVIAYRPAGALIWAQRASVLALLFLIGSALNRFRIRRSARRIGNYLPALRDHRDRLQFEVPSLEIRSAEVAAPIEVPGWLEDGRTEPLRPAPGVAAVPREEPKQAAVISTPAFADRQRLDPLGDLSELDAALALEGPVRHG